jgi:hypothetical protein
MEYDSKICEIINFRKIHNTTYYDILLPERNVELKSLSSITKISSKIKEKEYAIYYKGEVMEIVYITKIDKFYDNAFIQIYKGNVPEYFLKNDH